MKKPVLLCLSLCVLLFGCVKKKGLEYGLTATNTLRMKLSSEPPTLDWTKMADSVSAEIVANTMDGLVQYNLTDPELGLLPALATEWSSKDGKTWKFKIRKGVKWTDGVELTPQHIVDGFERLLNPKTAAMYSYALYPVVGAKDYNQGKLQDFSKVGISIVDGDTVQFVLSGPKSYFPYLLTHQTTYAVRKDLIEKFGDRWTDPQNVQTLGPYKMKVWDHDKALVLERNEEYWGPKSKITNILYYMIGETSTALNLFDSGKLDVIDEIPSREISKLKTRKEYHQVGTLSLLYYGFNIEKKPMDNLKVRKAIAHAIDRNQITEMLGTGAQPLSSWVPAGMFGYEPEIGLMFDPEKAAQLLDEAGFKDRSKLGKIQLSFNTNEDHQRVAENIQAQIKKNLGVEIEVKNEEWKTYLDSLKVNPTTLFRLGWLADYPDPDNFLSLMTSYSENNHTRWKSTKYDSLIEKGATELEKARRRATYADAQKILLEEDVAAIPLLTEVGRYLISDRVQKFPFNSLKWSRLDQVELKE